MISFLIKWVVNIIALLAVTHLIAGVSVESWEVTILAALVIGLLNAFLKPFFIFLTLPLNILSLGIFTLFINGFIFYLAAKFVRGFNVINFWSAFWAALLFSIISFLLNLLMSPKVSIRVGGYDASYRKHHKDDNVIDVEGKIVDEDTKSKDRN